MSCFLVDAFFSGRSESDNFCEVGFSEDGRLPGDLESVVSFQEGMPDDARFSGASECDDFCQFGVLDVARFLGDVVSFDSCQVGFLSDATRLGELLENVGLSPATTEA